MAVGECESGLSGRRKFPVDDVFRAIYEQIVNEGLPESQWAEIESDDMFQVGNYEGGFDADEAAFCFSVHTSDGEWWFQLTLDEIVDVVQRRRGTFEARPAEI